VSHRGIVTLGRSCRGDCVEPFAMETLEPRLLLSGSVVISEFMANNDNILADEDGEYRDWLELHNPSADSVNLDGWFLTDDPSLLDLWRLPAVTIPAGGFKVVFASDKDRDDPAGELHTDFKLDADGDYLALVHPDGMTVEYEYAPQFPRQVEDISYGVTFDPAAVETVVLVDEFSPARVRVPTDGGDGLTWTGGQAFDDSTWIDGSSAIGFETDPDGAASFEGYFLTDLEATMHETNGSAYMRIFVAYLNGVEIARANATDPMLYDSVASVSRADSLAATMTEFDVTASLGALNAGVNILAVHGLTSDPDNARFLISPELIVDLATGITDELAYFTTPSPGEDNVSGSLGLVEDTTFSVDRGFYNSPFDVEIDCDTDGAQIRYTLDGSTPTATHGAVYAGPIHIAGQTVLRAAAFKAGYQPSNVDTQTYIFIADVLTAPDVPADYPSTWNGDSYTRPGDYGMDPEIVNDPRYIDRMEDALRSLPTVSLVTDIANLFDPNTGIYIKATRDGMAYERPTSFEYFDADGDSLFQIDCGLRMRGGASRSQRTTPKHSFRLIFRDMYGAGKLNYPLFGDEAADSFDTIILRAGSNLSWPHHNNWPIYSENRIYAQYIRDQWAKATQLAMGWDSPHNNYAHLYINGIYWGLYNPGERPSAPYAAAYLGGDKEEYDVINSGEAIDGDMTAWNELINLGFQDMSIPANYQQMTEMLDVEAFADYMIINQFGGNIDWDHHNWHAYRNRNGGKWYFAMWDTEIIFVILHENQIDPDQFDNFDFSAGYFWGDNQHVLTRLWLQLLANDEFKTMYADRIHKHLFNDGLLTPDSIVESWNVLSEQIDSAIIAESARWGDYRRDVYYAGRTSPVDFNDDNILYDRDEEWIDERNRLMNTYFPQRTGIVIQQYKAFDVYPDLAAPTFNLNGSYQHGGPFDLGDTFSMTAASGTIVYTLDGADPRAVGGGISPTAVFYSAGTQIPLTRSTVVKARVYSGGQWSALNEAIYETAAAPPLQITEINYNPPAPTDDERAAGFVDNNDFEFIEIHNAGPQVDLRTVKLSVGVDFDFGAAGITTVAAGEYAVIVRNQAAFEARYGAGHNVVGQFNGRLDNAGERLLLTHGNDTPILHFNYDNSGSWPGRPDGKGATLELIDPAGDYNDSENWRSSAEYLGSPGAAGSGMTGEIVINEVLTHTDGEPTDSIELYNTTGAAVDIGGWRLSDTHLDYAKFRIPDGTILGAGEYIVFDEHDFNATGLTIDPNDDDPNDFALSGAYGDDVWLMEGDASGNILRFVDHVDFDAAANGESFGRWPNATGDLYPMSALSLGRANPGPRVGPVVISEVMYNPSGAGTAPLWSTTFDDGPDGFAYVANPFGTSHGLGGFGYWGAAEGATGGGVAALLNTMGAVPISGGWTRTMTCAQSGILSVSFAYQVETSESTSTDQYVQVMADIDGAWFGEADGLLRLDGDGGGGALSCSWQTATLQIPINSGSHTITLGGFIGGSVAFDYGWLRFDDVSMSVCGDSDDMEFLEVYNPTGQQVDLTEWRIRGGVDMNFDPGTTIPAGGRIVVLSFNPAKPENDSRVTAFRQTYGIDASVALVGGWDGRLSDNGESVSGVHPPSAGRYDRVRRRSALDPRIRRRLAAPLARRRLGSGSGQLGRRDGRPGRRSRQRTVGRLQLRRGRRPRRFRHPQTELGPDRHGHPGDRGCEQRPEHRSERFRRPQANVGRRRPGARRRRRD